MRVSVLCLCLLGACTQNQRYVFDNEPIALTSDTAATVASDDEDDALFIVERRFELPIVPLTDETRQSLREIARAVDLPYRRAPWVDSEAMAIEIDWVLANLDTQPVQVLVSLDGINEFHEYAPGPEDFHQWERRIQLDARQRVWGTITQEEMNEVAVDLATVVQAPNSNLVVYFENLSSLDERIQPFIPARIPGLVGFRMGLTSGAARNVVLEISVRVTDHGERLSDPDEQAWNLPNPDLFTPVAPEAE